MNALREALRNIRSQRPVNTLPRETVILKAPANTLWHGMMEDGRMWILRKNSNTSYFVEY